MLQAVRIRARPRWPRQVAGDKGYSIAWLRAWLHARSIAPVIPARRDQPGQRTLDFDRVTYRRRNVIERCVGWLKECRRIATRFEKLACHYLAMLKLAMIQRYLKTCFSNRT